MLVGILHLELYSVTEYGLGEGNIQRKTVTTVSVM